MQILENRNLILGSKSPRRSELLKRSGIPFTIKVMEVEETFPESLTIDRVAQYIASKKSEAFIGHLSHDDIVLTADSVVVHENQIYGKPKDQKDAVRMLLQFSDSWHIVYTGVCLRSNEKVHAFTSKSEVKFSNLSEEEATFYVENFNALDKAGSYGIQDWIGINKVEGIIGSYTNIMGLPTQLVYDELSAF